MELAVLKLYRSLYNRSCILSVINFRTSLNFSRNEHLGVKIADRNGEKKVLPNKLSTLYVPARYGGEMYQIVKPLIDVNFIADNIETIQRCCRLRHIELGCDGKDLVSFLKEWEALKTRFADICAKDKEFLDEQNRLKSLNLTAELESVMEEHSKTIDTLKKEKEKLQNMEDLVMPIVQKIPNNIDELCPIDCDMVENDSEVPHLGFNVASHVDIAKNMASLEFSQASPSAYFLIGKLAEFEYIVQSYLYDKFRDIGHFPMSCTDFCKSFIIEAIGLDPYSYDDCIPLKPKTKRDIGQRLHLVGGASFASFCAYFTNMNVARSTLPMKYFSFGRCYDAKHRRVESPDLFSVVQSSNIHCLVLCETSDEGLEFDALFNELISLYKSFGLPFRTVAISARNLNPTEMKRKQIELWSPSRQKYIPVSSVSLRGDFVSKRLRITFGEEASVQGYCSIVEGVAVNFPVLIGCIIENFQNPDLSFKYPEILTSFYNLMNKE